MFFTNEEELLNSGMSFFSCDAETAEYLQTFNKIPILFISKENGKHYFSRTKKLQKALDELPLELEAINGQ